MPAFDEQACIDILDAADPEVRHGFRIAAYSITEDRIYMPERSSFISDAAYYKTMLHELAHWTGHPSRLAREFGTSRDSEAYAREELRAEIASAMMAMRLGLPPALDDHAGYVEHYLKILRSDKKEIFRASRDAEKICKYVLSLHPEFRAEFEDEHREQMAAAVAAGAPEEIFDASTFDFDVEESLSAAPAP